jgi:hypothetical protein
MHKKFVVRLSDEERGVCQEIIKHLKGSSQKFRRAQILLKTDADGPAWSDGRTSEAFHCRVQTIEHLRKRLVTEGFAWALAGKKRQEPPPPLHARRRGGSPVDGSAAGEATVRLWPLALAPAGRRHGTRGTCRCDQ